MQRTTQGVCQKFQNIPGIPGSGREAGEGAGGKQQGTKSVERVGKSANVARS